MKRFKCTADDLVPGDLCTPGSKGETVERASRRKAEIDARRGLAARTAERRQRRSASTSPAPDLAARTARRRAASTSPARRAAPDDLAARTAQRRRRARRRGVV